MKKDYLLSGQYPAEVALIKLVYAYLHGKTPESVSADVIEDIVEAGFRQDMAPLTFCAVKDIPAAKEASRYTEWQRRFLDDMMRSEIQLAESGKLIRHLCEHGVQILPLKGVEIKKLYPSPVLRVMSDVDLLYSGVSSKELSGLMKDAGYTQMSVDTGAHDVYYKKPCMNIELHRQLVTDGSPYAACLEGVTANRIPDEDIPNLYHYRPEDLFIHVIAHAAKHLKSSGLGVRPLCDIYMLNQKYSDVWDRKYIQSSLQKSGLDTFAERLSGIAQKWFGDGMPDLSNEEERYFFSGGTYGGGSDTENWRYALSGKKSGLAYFMSRVFLPYSTMKSMYPVLRKWPVLLPGCWLVHWLDVLFHRKNRIGEVAKVIREGEKNRERYTGIYEALGMKKR